MSDRISRPEKSARASYIPYTALTLDEDFCVCTYGDAASCLFGYPEVSMLGKPVSQILPGLEPGQNPASSHHSSRILFNEVRMEAVHADGNTFPVMVGMRQDYQQGTCRHVVLIRNLESRPPA